ITSESAGAPPHSTTQSYSVHQIGGHLLKYGRALPILIHSKIAIPITCLHDHSLLSSICRQPSCVRSLFRFIFQSDSCRSNCANRSLSHICLRGQQTPSPIHLEFRGPCERRL